MAQRRHLGRGGSGRGSCQGQQVPSPGAPRAEPASPAPRSRRERSRVLRMVGPSPGPAGRPLRGPEPAFPRRPGSSPGPDLPGVPGPTPRPQSRGPSAASRARAAGVGCAGASRVPPGPAPRPSRPSRPPVGARARQAVSAFPALRPRLASLLGVRGRRDAFCLFRRGTRRAREEAGRKASLRPDSADPSGPEPCAGPRACRAEGARGRRGGRRGGGEARGLGRGRPAAQVTRVCGGRCGGARDLPSPRPRRCAGRSRRGRGRCWACGLHGAGEVLRFPTS